MADLAIRKTLADNDFFSGLSPEFIDFMADHAKARHLKEEEVLFHYGDRARHFYLLVSGNISMEIAAIEGPALQLQSLGPDAVLGWSWLISPYEWHFQARATAEADVLEFDGVAVLARCEDDPVFGYELLKRFSALMSERLQFARQRMMDEWKPAGFA